jgi:ABC-type lipoprotein release transport system permease subunit
MLLKLAFRGLLDRPWRSAFLLAGFALGVGVMITLLAIGEAMVVQSKDEKLVGGGDVTVLPEGIDLEVMKTGGVGGMFASIANARFVYRQLLAAPRFADRIATVAPQTDGALLYLRTADGTESPVRALGARRRPSSPVHGRMTTATGNGSARPSPSSDTRSTASITPPP